MIDYLVAAGAPILESEGGPAPEYVAFIRHAGLLRRQFEAGGSIRLDLAANVGDLRMVRDLLRRLRADLQEQAAHRWAKEDGSLSLIREMGRALHIASWQGYDEIVAYLIDEGVDVNHLDQPGEPSALSSAAWHGHVNVVRRLLTAGADPGYRDWFKMTADEHADENGYPDIALLIAETHPRR